MINIKVFVFAIVLLGILNCSHHSETPIDIPTLKANAQLQLARYLVKSEDVYNHIKIDDNGIKTYINDSLWRADEYEFFLPWEEFNRFRDLCENDAELAYEMYQRYATTQYPVDYPKPERSKNKSEGEGFQPTTNQPLKGLRIALDAGHIAGNLRLAKTEGKYIQMKYKGEKVAFWEADLAWHTANYLHRQLEKHGAIIMNTRAYGKTAFGVDYDTWYNNFDAIDGEKPDKSKLFWRFFRHKDNDERVKMVNAFRPDLTLIMHYNVDGNNRPWKRPCRTQYSMAFTGGAYMKGELFSPERRFNLLRLLITDDIEESAKFSNDVLQILQAEGDVPVLPGNSNQKYVNAIGIRTDYQGVYARNLALSGRIFGTLCYAEPLFQDHKDEVLRLNKRDFNFEGEMIPTRVVEIAKVYEKAILKYAKTLKTD